MTDHHAAKALAKRIVHAINVGECWEDPEHEGEIAIVTKLLTAALTPLAWTSERPVKEGWYWAIRTDLPAEHTEASVLHVELFDDRLYCTEHGERSPLKEFSTCLWAGPLPPPREETT